MALRDYLTIESGVKVLKRAIISFTGRPNELVATDSNGKIAFNLLPDGIEAPLVTATAVENIDAGDWVHFFDNGGVLSVERAIASDQTRYCNGFCLDPILSSNTGFVQLEGVNTGVTVPASAIGETFFLSAAFGEGSLTNAPLTDGYINQALGLVVGVNAVRFEPGNFEFIDIIT